MRRFTILATALAVAAVPLASASTFFFSDPSGLSAEAEFQLVNPTTLTVRLQNTSTGAPMGFDGSDQLLTGVSWDFGHPGFNGDAMITGGTVLIGSTSVSIDFDQVLTQLGPGDDVSGEWGYGNMDGTGALTNFVSANTAAATPFGGANRDGPVAIDGPQAGLVASPPVVGLGGLGAIEDEVVATLTLDRPVADLSFLTENLVRVEFGSDAAFITVPEPGTLALLLIAVPLLRRRR